MAGKRKRPKKKRTRDSAPLSAEEERLVHSFLQDLQKIDPTHIKEKIENPALAQAIVERLPADDPNSYPIMLALREAFDHKNIQKAIKKALFKFRQRGVDVPDLDSHKETPFRRSREAKVDPSAYLGPIDGDGNRGVFIALPQIPKGVDVGMGVVSDEKGVLQFLFGRHSKKRSQEVKRFFFENIPHLVQTSLAHAATILESCHGRSAESLSESAGDYLRLRPWILENVPLLSGPVIYDFLPSDSISEDNLTDSQITKLLEHELLRSWAVQPEGMAPLLEEISEVEKSRILVSGVQKSERIQELKEKSLGDLFPEAKRSLFRERLVEMAYIFFKRDEEDYARLALSAAQPFRHKDSVIGVNPFLAALVEWSLSFYSRGTGETERSGDPQEESPSGIIIP